MDKEVLKVSEKTAKYRTEIQQMMFVSGETGDPSPETTTMIEQIVQSQVIEMLRRATELANRQSLRSIGIDHIIFLIRHDKAKVSRLQSFLAWKDVRKNAKESDDKAGGGGGGIDDFQGDDAFGPGGGAGASGPGDANVTRRVNKKAKVRLPWDVTSFYNVQLPEREDDEGDEEEEEMNTATLQRLRNADERTKYMTREEYVHYSECRQASFTFRKGKRFREWAGFGVVTDGKPNDDVVDILGFLTFEIVQTLTEEALKVKAEEDQRKKLNGTGSNGGGNGSGSDGDGESGGFEAAIKKRKREMGLFEPPEEERSPVQPGHVQEGFRRLQQCVIRDKSFAFARRNHSIRRPLKFI